MVSIIFVLQMVTVLCKITVTFTQEETRIWTFLEELRVFIKLKQENLIIDEKTSHEGSYESLINKVFLKQTGKSQEKETKLKEKASTSNIESQENDEELLLIKKLASQLIGENGKPRSVLDWIQSYKFSIQESNKERYEKLEDFFESHYAKTKFSQDDPKPDPIQMDKICKMISAFIDASYNNYGVFIDHNDRHMSDRQIYRCDFDLLQEEPFFYVSMLPLQTKPHGYMIVVQAHRATYIVDYIQIPEPNQILIGHKLIDSFYSVEPSLLNFSYDAVSGKYSIIL